MASSSSTDNNANDSNTDTSNLRSSPPSSNTPRPWTEEHNPFIAFRRYADEQITSMLQSVMGIPSMMAPPHSNKWPHFDEGNHQRLRKGEEDGERDRSNDAWNHPRQWGRTSDYNDYFGSWTFPRHSLNFFDSFFDDRFPFGFGGFFSPEPLLYSGDPQTWPISYLLFSPYSPIHLERSQARGRHFPGVFSSLFTSGETAALDSSEPRWRDAFEDLLRVENGQPMLDRSTEADRNRQTGKEWLRGLIQRGSIGGNWRLIGPEDSPNGFFFEKTQRYNNNETIRKQQQIENDSENKTDGQPETELDLYDRFLDDIANAHERYSRAFADSPLMRLLEEERKRLLNREEPPQTSDIKTETKDWLEYTANGHRQMLDSQYKDEQSSTEPRVVLTSTRTVRRTQPDGSISTKTIKTRRFADGHEESDESAEVIPPPVKKNTNQNDSSSTGDDDSGNSKGGWFWTR